MDLRDRVGERHDDLGPAGPPDHPCRLPYRIHVTCDGRGPDILQERRAIPVEAALGQLPIHLLDVGHAGRAVVDHRFAPVGIELRVGLAAQRRRGMADAAGIEAHQVEPAADLRARQLGSHRGDHVDCRCPGPTRIDQQRSDPRTGRRNADHRELRLRASRVVVVDRDRNGGALRAGNVAGAFEESTAVPPVQLRRRRRLRHPRARRWSGVVIRRRARHRRRGNGCHYR